MKKFIIGLGIILISSQLALVKANEDISGIELKDFYHNVDFDKNGSYDYLNTFTPGSKVQGNFKYDDSLFFKEKYSKYGKFIPNEENNKYDIILSYKAPKDTCFNKDNVFSIKLPGNKAIQYFRGVIIELTPKVIYIFNTNNKNNLNNIFEYSIDNGNTWINYENKENFQNNITGTDCITDMRIKNPISKNIYDNNSIYTKNNYFIYRYAYDIPEDYKGDTLTETINLKLINNQTGTVAEKEFTNTLEKYKSEKVCKPGKLKFLVNDVVKKEGILKVEYYDKETREKISEDKIEKGEVDKDYSVEKIEIANYTYDSLEGEENGKFTEGETVVKYFYTKVKASQTYLGSAPSVPDIEKDSRVITTENTVKETPKVTDEKEKEIIKEALKIEEPKKEEKISFEPVGPIEISNEEIYFPKILPKTGVEHWLILLLISLMSSYFILNIKGRNS